MCLSRFRWTVPLLFLNLVFDIVLVYKKIAPILKLIIPLMVKHLLLLCLDYVQKLPFLMRRAKTFREEEGDETGSHGRERKWSVLAAFL